MPAAVTPMIPPALAIQAGLLPIRHGPVRFAIGSPDGLTSNAWRVWTSKRGDIYAACRDNFKEASRDFDVSVSSLTSNTQWHPRLRPYPYKRVEASIRFYHLNHIGVVEQRKELCSEIRRCVEDADRYFTKYQGGDGTARAAFEHAIRDLKGRVAAKARFSAAARAMLMGLRGTHSVVDVVLASA